MSGVNVFKILMDLYQLQKIFRVKLAKNIVVSAGNINGKCFIMWRFILKCFHIITKKYRFSDIGEHWMKNISKFF